MKLLLLSVLITAGFGCTSAPKQPETVTKDTLPVGVNTPGQDTTGTIQHIKEIYATINKQTLIQKSFEWETDTTCEAPPMGGTLTYFYRGNELVKMLNTGGEDHGSWKEEYYFDKGQLVFVYQNNTYGGAANPDEFAYQNRYYFANDQLIKKIESGSATQLDINAIQDMVATTYRLKEAGSSAVIARIFSCSPEAQ
jgi:hypothetical protein